MTMLQNLTFLQEKFTLKSLVLSSLVVNVYYVATLLSDVNGISFLFWDNFKKQEKQCAIKSQCKKPATYKHIFSMFQLLLPALICTETNYKGLYFLTDLNPILTFDFDPTIV